MQRFLDRFVFDASKVLHVGVEREQFTRRNGIIAPIAHLILAKAGTNQFGPWEQDFGFTPDERFGYELSACQVESRIGPCKLTDLKSKLYQTAQALNEYVENARTERDRHGHKYADHIFDLSDVSVAPADMPLDIYPDATGRYKRIAEKMPRHVLLAACRVIGTHIHVGMPDHETALRVYNQVIKKYDWLCARGNGSFGERLDIYRIVAPDCDPKPYADWADFYRVAMEKDFHEDPRKCWTLIRISKHGTIEFRMFGATDSIERIVGWAKICHDLCKEAMT